MFAVLSSCMTLNSYTAHMNSLDKDFKKSIASGQETTALSIAEGNQRKCMQHREIT